MQKCSICLIAFVAILSTILFKSILIYRQTTKKYQMTLDEELKEKYKGVVKNRSKVAKKSMYAGLIGAGIDCAIVAFMYPKTDLKMYVCIAVTVIWFIRDFYYRFAKKESMLPYLDKVEDRKQWWQMYTEMQHNYYSSLAIATCAAGIYCLI